MTSKIMIITAVISTIAWSAILGYGFATIGVECTTKIIMQGGIC